MSSENKEYERRWLVNINSARLIELLPFIQGPAKKINQGYLTNDPDRVVRVRQTTNGESKLTIKGRRVEGECMEVETPLSPSQANDLIKICTTFVKKHRFEVFWSGLKFELDLFEGYLTGLAIVELEFNDKEGLEREIETFGLPSWVGVEITDDSFFSNLSLSTKSWSEVRNHIIDITDRAHK